MEITTMQLIENTFIYKPWPFSLTALLIAPLLLAEVSLPQAQHENNRVLLANPSSSPSAIMVVGAFPAAKLGVLAMKQISKPIANLLKERAKNSPFFRKYVCMPPAQFYNWMEVKTKMWALNLGKPTTVPVLNEAMAIDLGANLLGEIVIFTIGAGLLLLEYQRQARKEAMKEEMALQEKLELQATINDLNFQIQRLDTQLREVARVTADLESKSSWKPKILDELPFTTKKNKHEQPLYIPATPERKDAPNAASGTAQQTEPKRNTQTNAGKA